LQQPCIPFPSNTAFRKHTPNTFSILACTWPPPCAAHLALAALLVSVCIAIPPPGAQVLPSSVFDSLSSLQFVAFDRYPCCLRAHSVTVPQPLSRHRTFDLDLPQETLASSLPCMRRACTSLTYIPDPPTVLRVNVISIDALHTNCVHRSVNGHQDTVYHIDRIVCLACWDSLGGILGIGVGGLSDEGRGIARALVLS
jgi:hypothetical protein